MAFLNAPLVDADDDPELEAAAVLRPPPLLVKLGYARPGECYRADKAIYGLRQSPKRWGDHRNRRLFAMKTKSGYVFRPSVAEQNLWRILWIGTGEHLEEGGVIDSQLYGFLLVYVDDLINLDDEMVGRRDSSCAENPMGDVQARVARSRLCALLGNGDRGV